MMPDPTTIARSSAVPVASLAMRFESEAVTGVSVAAPWRLVTPLRSAQVSEEPIKAAHRSRIERVIRPATLPPIADEPGVLENPQVKREERLLEFERFGQLADAMLASAQQVNDTQPRFL